jgi:hypothetical protein
MSFKTANLNNKGSPDGDQGMPSASDSLHVPVREVQGSKIWVLVESTDFPIVDRIWSSDSGDTAGTFVTVYSQRDLDNTENIPERFRTWGMTRQFKGVDVHHHSKTWLTPLRVPISSSTGPFHDSHVLPHIAAKRESKFIGPAYPNRKKPKWINDTQLCVSGKVEEYDASLEDAAIREIREEIGTNFEIREIRQMAEPVEANGFTNYLFFACI